MKYSVIIPTRNRAYCLWRAINSLLAQSFEDMEILVVDGCSSDDTDKLVNSYDDTRIKLILNENDNGVASARNKGILESKGDYIGYLDSDDFVYLNWLSGMNHSIESNPKKILFMPNKDFIVKQVDKAGKVIKVFKQELLFNKTPTCNDIVNLNIQCDTNGMIHKRELIDRIGLWNMDLKLYEDFEFLLRFSEKFPNGLEFVPEVLVSYSRVYGKNSLCSMATYRDLIESLEKVYSIHGNNQALKGQTWYPSLVNKFKVMAKSEEEDGVTILDHLINKYALQHGS